MRNLNTLEARVAAATQSLAGQHGQAQELHGKVQTLEDELTRSRADLGRLQSELSKASEEKSKIEERLESLSGENRRLINDATRNRDEISRLEADVAELRQERDKLTALLDSLVQAIETRAGVAHGNNLERTVETSGSDGAIEIVRPSGAVCQLPRPEAQASEPGWLALGSAKPHVDPAESDGDIPNEAARRLMDRIRERIEAHHRA